MHSCAHTRWLRLIKGETHFVLESSDRLDRLIPPSEVEKPISLIATFGNQVKSSVLTDLGLVTRHLTGANGQGVVHLLASPLTDRAGRPVVLADGDIPTHNRLPTVRQAQACHETTWTELQAVSENVKPRSVALELYHRCLLPHLDVVCLFVADLGGTETVLQILRSWIGMGRATTSPIRPTLVLVAEKGRKAELRRGVNDLASQSDPGISDIFRQVTVLNCVAKNKTRKARVAAVRYELLQGMTLCHDARLKDQCLFSWSHAVSFIRESTNTSSERPFDFIRSSRSHNPVSQNHAEHLINFLSSYEGTHDIKTLFPLVASSFILDHYPPGMHTFNPAAVFRTLYRDTCLEVLKSAELKSGQQLPGDFAETIEREMTKLFGRYRSLESSAILHREQMSLVESGAVGRGQGTCCYCLGRDHERQLPCGHVICHTCIRIFYRENSDLKNLYEVDACLLCGERMGDLRIGLKPPTASVRVLSIDGGGSRARIPLEFLLRLEQCIGLPYPVQRNFDVAFGTSSGAMAVCAMYVNGWPVDLCIRLLDVAARVAFHRPFAMRTIPSLLKASPGILTVVQVILSLLRGSKYAAQPLEMVLRDMFGSERSVLDSDEASEMGVMLGLTLTATKNAETYVATNYNSADERNKGYFALNQRCSIADIPLWEILRCCTAAPYYFPVHHIGGAGTFQDGGLAVNNPAPLAVREAARRFPTSGEPSIVASFGTGSVQEAGDKAQIRSFWQDWFPLRLLRAFFRQGDSAAAWNQLISRGGAEKRDGFFRFDVHLDEDSLPLDDVRHIDEMGRVAREAALSSPTVKELARKIRAELFVFELDPSRPPQWIRGRYECVGNISCRLGAQTNELQVLLQQLHQGPSVFRFQNQSLKVDCGYVSAESCQFQQPIEFCVKYRREPFAICLEENGTVGDGCAISGSPFTLDRLIQEQKLDARFGTSDHRKRERLDEIQPDSSKRQRRL